ncbi:unnamed protein product, partial [Rotaria magnacalcarata]
TVTRERPELIINSPSSTLSSSSSNDAYFETNSLLYKSESNSSIKVTDETTQQHRFHVRSLGWTTIEEEDLTNERSSRAVNRCIYESTRGINDGIGRWGEGKDLYMDINNTDLLLIDPTEMTILHKQSIPSIRVWGVGRENSRDFAYVAKDKDRSTHTYKCHVFRCDNASARTIANTLRDICRNLMIERGLLSKTTEILGDGVPQHIRSASFTESIIADTPTTFPTPMEEPKNNISCTYLGCVYVEKPGGMDVLRPAIELVSTTVPEDKWLPVFVDISPSSLTISYDNESKGQLLDVRIRYLSFLVIDGSFTQPLESTRLPQTSNWSPNNTTIRSSKTIPCVTKSEQQLYKLYAQALADSEVTQDWSSWVEMMAINCQKCCSEAEISHPIAFRTGRQTQLSRNIRMLQVERDSWLLWNRARDTLNNTRQDLPEV